MAIAGCGRSYGFARGGGIIAKRCIGRYASNDG